MTLSSIELSGLVKSFHDSNGRVPAVAGINVSIRRGETVALLGPNGAGKSTTLDMLLGLTEARLRHRVDLRDRSPRGDRGRRSRSDAADRRPRRRPFGA